MQPANSGQALQQLQTAQSTVQDPNAILQSQNQALGVNAAQQTVGGLRGAIDNTTKLLNQVAPSVMGRTANSLVTNAQATRQIGNEEAPISKTLSDESGKYNEANTDLDRKTAAAQQASEGIYKGQQDKLSYLQNIYNTLYGQEKDTQARQDAAAAAAENARQFNVSQSNENARAAASRASSKAAAPTKADVASHVVNQFNSLRGRDGYVSNETWANALNDFTAIGGTPRQFFQNYGQYVNPKFKTSYAGWVNR